MLNGVIAKDAVRSRVRRLLLAASVPLLAAVALVGSAASASAAGNPVVTLPVSSATVGSNIPIAFTLPTAPVAGTVVVTITGTAPVTLPTVLTLSGTSQSVSFTVQAANVTAQAPIANVTGPTSITDGTYTFSVTYEAASDSTFGSASVTGVTVQRATVAPTLSAPTGSTGAPVSVQYTLPEAPLASSVRLTFVGSVTRTLTLGDTVAGVGISFSFDPAHPTLATKVVSIIGGATIPDGTYTVLLSYQDYLGNPSASSAPTTVTIDTVTQTPVLTSPVAGAALPGSIPIAFSLPEIAASGTVDVQLAGASTYNLTLADTAAGSHSVSVDPADPSAQSDVTGFTGGNGTTIAPGTYTVTLKYQDALLNSVAFASSANVIVSACAAGHYSATGASPCVAADPGSYVPADGATAELNCVAGSYEDDFGGTACKPSPAGRYAGAGAILAPPCPAGSYCPASSGVPTNCAAGTYNPVTQSASSAACLTAPAGTYAGAAAAVPTSCPAGTYNPNTSSISSAACIGDEPGSWSAAQASAPTLCVAGSYAAAAQSTSCRNADPGFYVGAAGASAEAPCPAGSFAADTGASSCVLAPVGSYAPAGSILALPCPSGTSTTASGAAGCQPVTLGSGGAGTGTGAPGDAVPVTVAVQSVARLKGGRLRLVVSSSAPGVLKVRAKVRGSRRPYGSAKTTKPASLTTVVIRAHGRAARKVSSRKRFTITVTFTPSGGGATVTKTVTVKPKKPPKTH